MYKRTRKWEWGGGLVSYQTTVLSKQFAKLIYVLPYVFYILFDVLINQLFLSLSTGEKIKIVF